MKSYLLVFVGGGIGASLRHTVNMVSARGLGTAFPWGTFIINISGSLVMGLVAGYLAARGYDEDHDSPPPRPAPGPTARDYSRVC